MLQVWQYHHPISSSRNHVPSEVVEAVFVNFQENPKLVEELSKNQSFAPLGNPMPGSCAFVKYTKYLMIWGGIKIGFPC